MIRERGPDVLGPLFIMRLILPRISLVCRERVVALYNPDYGDRPYARSADSGAA